MMPGDPMMGFLPPEAMMAMAGQQPQLMQPPQATVGQLIAGQPAWTQPTDSTMAAMGAPAMSGAPGGMPNLGQILQAVQRPAPTQPIMHGGVTAAQKAPEMQVHAGQSGTQLQALLALLTGRGQAPAVPTLGNLIR